MASIWIHSSLAPKMKLSSLLPDIGPPVFHHRAVGNKIRTDRGSKSDGISMGDRSPGSNRWRYINILGGYPLKLRPEKYALYMVGTSNLGS